MKKEYIDTFESESKKKLELHK